jgi:hypothetical protein
MICNVERTLVRYFVLTESLGNGLKSVLRRKSQPLRRESEKKLTIGQSSPFDLGFATELFAFRMLRIVASAPPLH